MLSVLPLKRKEPPMPLYFFHLLHPDREPVRDEEGLTFEDDATATREGMRSLGELLIDVSPTQPMPLRVSVQIERAGVGVVDLLTAQRTSDV
jgi:hypothetical protein